MPQLPDLDHERFLRMAFAIAREAGKSGEHPFGCLLVGSDGTVILEQGNAFKTEGRDMTAHAERMIATRASKAYSPEFLASCTLYTSAEPCAMCSGALYWAGVGRIVFGQTERSLKDATGDHPENPTLDLPCRAVFAAGLRDVEIIGPLLEEEAAALQEGFWKER
jgi:tRNA(Arg) A34 adenosine deaminase TadA